MSWISDVREEIGGLDLSLQNLRKFALTVGPIFLLLAAWLAWKGHRTTAIVLTVLALALILTGAVVPRALRPVYQAWMGMSFAIGWVVSRIIISVIFFLVLTPLGVLARATGKDFLDVEMKRRRDSYWSRRDGKKIVNYEKLY